MVIVCDSREKWTQSDQDRHIRDYFERHGIEFRIEKLDVGDYMIEGHPEVAVDRKQSLEELSRNLMNKRDSSRFWREVRRAKSQGTKLIILCEHGGKIRNINDVAKWKSKYSPVHGRRLVDEMIRLEMSYGTVWLFCDRRSTAKRIIEILKEETKEGDA